VKYKTVFVNAGNPQLQLLAYFLVAMLNSNEEATTRVFGSPGIRIARRNGVWHVHGPTEALDIMIATETDEVVPEPTPERIAMITDIFNKIKELNR
jgi:hypothetical protein